MGRSLKAAETLPSTSESSPLKYIPNWLWISSATLIRDAPLRAADIRPFWIVMPCAHKIGHVINSHPRSNKKAVLTLFIVLF
jgi:hypothetical protein